MRFLSSDERKALGGSDYLELQYCRLPTGTAEITIVSPDAIRHGRDDSLFVQDESGFWTEYHAVFGEGLYANLRSGSMDIFGINYYAPERLGPILERLYAAKPAGYERLTGWLEKAKAYNGFYILGI